jgi:hypothetical protein
MMATRDVLYTTDAKMVCPACYAKADIVETDKRAGNNIKSAAWGALGASILSLFFNPFYFFTISSAISAFYALGSLSRKEDERFTKHIAKERGLVMAAAIAALVINALALLIVQAYIHSMMR